MKVSEVILKLEELKALHGDIDVEVYDSTVGEGEAGFTGDATVCLMEDDDTKVVKVFIGDRETVLALT